METKKENKSKQKKIVLLLLLLVLLLAALILVTGSCEGDEPAYEETLNKIVEMDPEDRQAAVNKMVEDGMINIQYQSGAVFDGDVSVSFNVKNIENNHHPLVFTIIDGNERVLYESEEIPPGYEINSIQLKKSLSKGTHDCRIIIGYAVEGSVSSSFPITIEVR